MVMKEKIIDDLKFLNHNKIILSIDQNQYILISKKENKNDNIIGLFTDGVISCCSIYISFNNEDFIFFTHIDEQSNIIEVVEKCANKIKNEKIEKIDVIYSKGPKLAGKLVNNYSMDYDKTIEDIIIILKNTFNNNKLEINKKVRIHQQSISFLIFFSPKIGEINYLDRLKEIAIEKLKRRKLLHNKMVFNNIILKQINELESYFDKDNNITYYYDSNMILGIKSQLGIYFDNN